MVERERLEIGNEIQLAVLLIILVSAHKVTLKLLIPSVNDGEVGDVGNLDSHDVVSVSSGVERSNEDGLARLQQRVDFAALR